MSLSQTRTPRVRSRPDNHLAQLLVASCSAFRDPMTFSWFAQSWLVQIILYLASRGSSQVKFHREIIEVGRDHIALDWDIWGLMLPPNAPIVLLFPTLLGGSSELAANVLALRSSGYRCVVMIRRGHAGLPLSTPCWNIMGNVADVEAALARIYEQYPKVPVSFVAVSAGTGLASLYLAKHGATADVHSAVLQCPAYDLMKVFTRIHWLFDMVFLIDIKRRILWRHRRVLRNAPRYWQALLGSWRMQSLLENLWGVAGYSSYEEFEQTSNPIHTIGDIRRPTLCINMHDDPACVRSLVPVDIYDSHPSGILLELEYGGHVGGFTSLNSTSAVVEATRQFLDAVR